jgi:GT2 family glycosyltransferase
MPSIPLTIVVPTINRPEATFLILNELTKQTIPSFEVIVLDQSDRLDKKTAEFQTDSFTYVYHHIEEKGLPNARNVAAQLAHGDILVFIDDDVRADYKMAENYLLLFNEHDDPFTVLGGRIHEQGSRIFRERKGIVGGKITVYGKTLKNFDTDSEGKCEWVAGGNFAVRRADFLEIGGFDKSFIGNAMLEDADFSYRIREAGGTVYYSPRPKLEHLRIPTGGTRIFNRDKSMFYRAHNSVYFFRRHKPIWQLLLVFLYLNGIAGKDFLQRKHSLWAFFYTWLGFVKGFTARTK